MRVEVRNRRNLCSEIDGNSVAVISISDPFDKQPTLPTWPELREILSLSFHDIDEQLFDVIGDELEKYTIMSDDDGNRVAAFVKKHKDVDLLIVQCDAGISRSSGMAAAILKHLTDDDSQIFRDDRYIPNRWVNRKTREALSAYGKQQHAEAS